MNEEETTRSESSVFAEFEKASKCIGIVTDPSSRLKDSNGALAELRGIFDKYLELPSLLDRHIETMVSELAVVARSIMEDFTVDKFWESPLPRIFSALYALSKVRGRKRIQKFLPHEVQDVEAVLDTLQALDKERSLSSPQENVSEANGGPQLWESIYSLWNWMGILSLVPFDCSVVVDSERISDLVQLAKSHLSEAGPTREIAAACLASWLSRPDLEQTELKNFREWSTDVLTEYSSRRRDIFRAMGILQTLVTILKVSTADRETVLKSMGSFWPTMLQISESEPSNLILRKYLVKWWTRLGSLYLPPRVALWRYKRGRRSLKENLIQSTTKNTLDIEATTRDTNNAKEEKLQCDEFFLVPDQVEEATGRLIAALTDPSTAVRWSAAKGIGRITERLPMVCAEDVLDALLELFEDIEKDNDWHGACLALAELARRGLLLPHRLQSVIPKIVEAMSYDVPRRQTSVGAHVRDAACYTYWAIARAYAPDILKPFVPQLSQSVALAFLFDREVNCRRAASAAFQEFVGRQGTNNFKHGISILTTADYFSLGNRSEAYTSICLHVAQFNEYRRPIIDHLFHIKLCHWDPSIRSLASKSLKGLVPLDTEYFRSTVVPYLLQTSLDERDVQLRHGSVLGLAEIILAYETLKSKDLDLDALLTKELMVSIAELVPTIEKKRLYRGKGGEQMRNAVCRLIECISITLIPFTVPQQVRLLDTIDACVPHPSEAIQEQAGRALFALMHSYFPVSSKGPTQRLQSRVVDKYVKEVRTSINPAVTRGFSLALGYLPSKLLAPSSKVLDTCLAPLCRASRPDAKVGNDKDAETRRNALVSLARICKTVGVEPRPINSDECIVGLTQKQVGHVFAAFFRSLNDYNMERRGDVGSMSRIVAMQGLETLALVTTKDQAVANDCFTEETCIHIVGGLLKQLAEKLDSIRSEAGNCLVRILTQSNPPIPHIPHKDLLIRALKIESVDRMYGYSTNWADASVTFPIVIQAIEIVEFFEFVVSGLVISVGCLTQSVAKHASAVLLQWIKESKDADIDRLGRVFLSLFEKHQHEGRVVLPLLKTISLLMDHMCIDRLIHEKSFSSPLLSLLQQEERGCKDVHRLTAILHVSLGLLTSTDSEKEPLAFVCRILGHPFPRVRRIAAENLYVRLLENPSFDEKHPALNLLLSNPWDGDESQDRVQKMVEEVVDALGIDPVSASP